jgi:hypothetical protein
VLLGQFFTYYFFVFLSFFLSFFLPCFSLLQVFASLQCTWLMGLQVTSVHGSMPEQLPSTQTSFSVAAMPSSHGAPLFLIGEVQMPREQLPGR